MTEVVIEHIHSTRDGASDEAAALIAAAIQRRASKSERSDIVVSGGTTPLECFRRLSRKNLAWGQVRVFLSDERWVSSDHDSSNENMVRRELLDGPAESADLLSIFAENTQPDERCLELQLELPGQGFAMSMLGMGTDGHFASLFADAKNLDVGLDNLSSDFYIPIETSASPHPRISMTLSALLTSKEILLLFFGDEKRAIFERAKAGDETLPIAALLQNAISPVHVVWAP